MKKPPKTYYSRWPFPVRILQASSETWKRSELGEESLQSRPATQPLILETPTSLPGPVKARGKPSSLLLSSQQLHQPAHGPTNTSHECLHMSFSNLTMSVASIGLSNFGASINLCEKIQTAQVNSFEVCYGTITDQRSRTTRRYTVYSKPVSEHVDSGRSWAVISLREVLQRKIPARSIPLSYLHRLQLGVVISLSTVQPHNTPWFPDTLSTRDIFFP